MAKVLTETGVAYLWKKMKDYVASHSSGGISYPSFKYSTSEQWTGEYWQDGRKIYTKTLYPTVPQSGEVDVAHSISNIGDYRAFDYNNSYFQNKSSKEAYAIGVYLSPTAWCFPFAIDTTKVKIRFGADFVSGWNLVVTIRYTKSTDTPV